MIHLNYKCKVNFVKLPLISDNPVHMSHHALNMAKPITFLPLSHKF